MSSKFEYIVQIWYMEESIMRNVAEWNSESDESTMKHQLPCIIGSFFFPFRITYWHYS